MEQMFLKFKSQRGHGTASWNFQFPCVNVKLQLLRQNLTQITISCPCNDCTSRNVDETKAYSLCLCSKQNQTAFITKTFPGLPPCPPISPCLLFKTSLGFESMAWCQGKNCQFWFKYLFWRFKIMLAGSFMASKFSPTVQLQAVGFCSLRGRNGTDIWALNTDLKVHHKETTDLPRVHSFLTAQWEIKK